MYNISTQSYFLLIWPVSWSQNILVRFHSMTTTGNMRWSLFSCNNVDENSFFLDFVRKFPKIHIFRLPLLVILSVRLISFYIPLISDLYEKSNRHIHLYQVLSRIWISKVIWPRYRKYLIILYQRWKYRMSCGRLNVMSNVNSYIFEPILNL